MRLQPFCNSAYGKMAWIIVNENTAVSR